MTNFGDAERARQARFRDASPTISEQGRSPTDDGGQRHDYMLERGCEDDNLYPRLRGEDGARKFLKERRIKWWIQRHYDSVGSSGPTRNMASSQIMCINFLLPLARIPDALTAAVRAIDDDVVRVVDIHHEGRVSPVEFEWIGVPKSLEGTTTRGQYTTSVDAFVIADTGGGRNNLRIDLAPDLPWVMADRLRIVQVLGNLLSNAARHSPEASSIRVSAVREGVHVAVSVADDGMGVSADLLPHLFRKFSRIDGDDRGSGIAGSGLGLAICKGIVEAHGGRIWAESGGPGLGARFTLTLPAVEEAGSGPAAGAAPLSSRSPRRAAGEQVRVLAVDDDPQALRYVRDALSKAGYTPIVTGDPEEALRLLEEEKPRLALLDLMLPGADGIELMRDILETADVPVIFLSAYGRDELIARAFDMGAADYVVKPFSPTELAARIRAALRRREAPEQAEPTEPYTLGDLEIDYAERRVSLASRPVRLIAIEYRMLAELSANAGRAVTYEHLLKRIWGAKSDGDVRPMRTVVSSLRRKLGDDADNPTYIFTEPRVGYRMPKGEKWEHDTEPRPSN